MADPKPLDAAVVLRRYRRLRARRRDWESHWQEAYDYALPQRDTWTTTPGGKRMDKLFDGTAPDAVEQLAASLLARLTPPWSRWIGLAGGPGLDDAERQRLAPRLEQAAAALQTQLDRSNFAVEVHQCFLDLVTGGTASLLFEEADPGAASAFRFTAVPLGELFLEEGPEGRPDVTFRRSVLSVERFRARFPKAPVPEAAAQAERTDGAGQVAVVEAVLPHDGGYGYVAFVEPPDGTTGAATGAPTVLADGRFAASPFINFRWMKAPGEAYGRSPVMKALPDIKTANKVVELVLKNATIAVTGIWQADDDGVLNPATVRLVPGSIIPKAVGSHGLTPLVAPGQFDLSDRLLVELRTHIRRALLVDRLGQVEVPKMTATEVLERAEEVGRVLGATYGRLQSELLTPLIGRALAILRRRGEVPPFVLDGRTVDLQYRSPLASAQAQQEAQQVMAFLRGVVELGPQALQTIDAARTARWMARAFNVPPDLLRDPSAPGVPPVAPAPGPGVLPQPVGGSDGAA